MDTTTSPQADKRADGPVRAWLSRQPEWLAQMIAIAITWVCVLLCVLVMMVVIQALGG